MSLTEKLSTIANNIPKVYNAGYEKGVLQGGGVIGDPYEVLNAILNGTITEFYTEEDLIDTSGRRNIGRIFNDCTYLTKWAMPKNTHSFAGYEFRYCSKLTYIDVGKTSELHQATFYGKPLKGVSLVIRSETPPTLSGAFSGTSFDNTTSIYVPKNSIDLYKTTTNWTTYSDCYKAIEDYPEITGGII